MNALGILFIFTAAACILIGWGLRFVHTKLKLRGATLMVELERATGDMKLDWRKPTRNWYNLKRHHGEADVPLAPDARWEASFIRRNVDKDGAVTEAHGYNPWGNRTTGLRAFIVDAATGLPLIWHPTPKADQAPYHLLDGYALNKIRKDIRIKAIQANNGVDMAAIAKLLLIGLALVLAAVLFIAWKMKGA